MLLRIIVAIIAGNRLLIVRMETKNSRDTVNMAPDFKGLLIQAESSPQKIRPFKKIGCCPLAVLLFEPALRPPKKMAWQSPGSRLKF